MTHTKLYAQGDILLEPVAEPALHTIAPRTRPTRLVVLAYGEATGHTHRIERGAILFRDDALARDIPTELYIGHLAVTTAEADLVHEEHDTITLPRGMYRVRRQREHEGDLIDQERARLVLD
jgi:hypothetical protein